MRLASRPADAGLHLAARYGYITNSLGYCGPAGTGKILYDFVCGGRGKESPARVRKALEGFEALYPYLQLIARKNGIANPLDERVVRAHFTGGPLLAGDWQSDLADLIRNTFSKRGLPQKIADKLAARVPRRAVPHHSFHVLFIHTITGRVPATRATENSCLISVGKYSDVSSAEDLRSRRCSASAEDVRSRGRSAFVLRRFIEPDGKLGEPKPHKVKIDERFLGRAPRKGELLALHWDFAVEKLTEAQAALLLKYTRRNLASVSA